MTDRELLPLNDTSAVSRSRHSALTSASTMPWIGQPFNRGWPILLPLVAIVSLAALFRWTTLDPFLSSFFYDQQSQQWPWFFHAGCTLFYRGGIYPAFVLFGLGCVMLAVGLARHRAVEVRAGLFLVLVFIIGPGLIVNQGFKNHWGRPRPHQIQDFGGLHAFVPVGSPGPLQQHNSSFPSGHAAVAFYLMSPGFILHARRRRLSNTLLFGGLLFGGAMALVRVIQGGHFVSDVLSSAAIVYFTAVILSRIVLQPSATQTMIAEHQSDGGSVTTTRAGNAPRSFGVGSIRSAA